MSQQPTKPSLTPLPFAFSAKVYASAFLLLAAALLGVPAQASAEASTESPSASTKEDSEATPPAENLEAEANTENQPDAEAQLSQKDSQAAEDSSEEDWDEAGWDVGEGLEFELDTVVVTATRGERDLADAPATVSVVSAEELKKAPVGDLSDALRHTPGLSLSAGSQGRREINLRGMGSSHTLILVDGKRVNSREAAFRHNDFDIGQIPVESIERIEIVRGSVSALYGSEALGGVINIITKRIPDKWSAGVDLKGQLPTHGLGGQEGQFSGYAAGPLIKDRLGLRFTHSADLRRVWHGASSAERWSPVVDKEGQRVLRDTKDPESVVLQRDLATLEGRQDHSTTIQVAWTPDSRQTIKTEYSRAEQSRYGEYFFGNYGNANAEIKRDDLSLAHEGKWDWGSSLARGYWERVDTNTDGLFQDNLILEANSSIVLGKHLLTVGGEARFTQLQSPAEFKETGKASDHQEAIYVQNEWEIHRMLTLLVGGRLDYHQNFGFWPTPRGYLVFSPLDGLTLKGGVGTGFRSPTLRQMSTESIVGSCRTTGGCYLQGNPELKPETSVSYEVAAGWNRRSHGVNVTVFQNDVSNLIERDQSNVLGTLDGRPLITSANINKARMRGIESSAYFQLRNILKLSANYTFLDARDLSADKGLDNRPTHSGNVQGDWRIIEPLSIFARGQYIGTQSNGDMSIPAYLLFDAGASYELLKNLSVSAGVLNIGNSRTYTSDGFPYQERGRTAYLGLNGKI